MKIRGLVLLLSICLLTTGCASLLEREYIRSEPHSSKFWESEAAGTLRAENYQDIVNDLLLLIGQHRELATLRLYNFTDDLTVTDALERAAAEVQQETPMGAYAVEFITSSNTAQRGYYEAKIQIGYRRTLKQIQDVVTATNPEAIYRLLEMVLPSPKRELAVRLGYWGTDGRQRVEETVARLRTDKNLDGTPGWTVNFYPENDDTVGIVEILLDVPPEEETDPLESAPDESGEGETGEAGEEGAEADTETDVETEQEEPVSDKDK